MGLPNVMDTGRSAMVASRAAVATTGHNISNANTEGYSRQRVHFQTNVPQPGVGSKGMVGRGVLVERIERVNDEYLEKQVRNGSRDLSSLEEKDFVLKQVEDVFNEMDGEGLNRIMSKFFNEFRQLGNDPDSEAVRQSVRESSQALVSDFRRIRRQIVDVQNHIDSRLEGYTTQINAHAKNIRDLNVRIKQMEIGGAFANDLQDQRDLAIKNLGNFLDIATHKDKDGAVHIDVKGIGPLVSGSQAEEFSVARTKADGQGKPENAYDLITTASASPSVTHQVSGGKVGALLSARDQTLSTVLERLDGMAYDVANAVNQIHSQGFTRTGATGVDFFKLPISKEAAAEVLDLSDAVKGSSSNIASAALPNAPGDNRIAIAISGLQHLKLTNSGLSTADDFYNSIVSDVGVVLARNSEALGQQKNIMGQLTKMREQLSGVSLDEETANLLQYQHTFDASAKVIQVADEMLNTILSLKR